LSDAQQSHLSDLWYVLVGPGDGVVNQRVGGAGKPGHVRASEPLHVSLRIDAVRSILIALVMRIDVPWEKIINRIR